MPFDSSQRMRTVQAPMIPIVGQWTAETPGTISLGQGVVHYSPPPGVAAAVAEAVANDPRVARYTAVQGTQDFLDAARQKLAQQNGIEPSGDRRLLATAGSNMGFVNAVLSIADVGDEIILLAPYYFNHDMAIEMAGCRTVAVPTDTDYQIDLPAIEAAITDRTRAVVTVSPNNPTGAVYPAHVLKQVNGLCRERGVYHISDEAYEDFTYAEAQHFSPAALPDSLEHTISLFSLSKAYGMAGWRVGYMVIPAGLESAVKKVQDTNLVCPPVMSQIAGAAALGAGSEWVARQTAGLSAVRDVVLGELAQFSDRCQVPKPQGAFYALLRLKTDLSDLELCERLIREHQVAVLPGRTFGVEEGCTLRVAYGALEAKTVAEGMARLLGGLRAMLEGNGSPN